MKLFNMMYIFDFLNQKTNFFWLFRTKNYFLDFLALKNSLNLLKTLKKRLFRLQIDYYNNIFSFRLYSKKLPYTSDILL